MVTAETIEQAVIRLPPAECDAAAWDRQIEADAAADKLDSLIAEALADYNNGLAREL